MTKTCEYEYKNLTKTQKDCLILVESLGIYELRALARVFGDNSPTIAKRNDHIKVIMDKIISGEDLRAIPMRPGRPYKELSNIEGILTELSQITGKDYNLKANQNRSISILQKVVTFNQTEDNIVKQRLRPLEVEGVLLERSVKEFYLTDLKHNVTVLVKKSAYETLNLYDYVSGIAVVMNAENEYILESVKKVNFQNFDTYQEEFSPYEKCLPTQSINLNGQSVVLGTRNLLKDVRFAENAETLKTMVEELKKDGILTLGLVPNVMDEEVERINSIGFDVLFSTKYEKKPLEVSNNLNTFIQFVLHMQKLGFKLALFVQDITSFADAIDFAFKNNTKVPNGRTEIAVETVKKLVLLAQAGGEDKHTTLFITYDDADVSDQMFVSTVFKVSKRL